MTSGVSLAQPRSPRRDGIDHYRTAMVLGFLLAVGYLAAVMTFVQFTTFQIWGGLVIGPVPFAIAAPFLHRHLTRVESDPWIRNLVMIGFGAKLVFSYVRFATNEFVLGRGDSIVYHNNAVAVSAEFRNFVFGGPAFERSIPDIIGTEFIRLLLSIVYTFIGDSRLAGFALFSFMSFWGLFLFYRAFAIAVPDGLRRRYAVLVFFLPSTLFWPSSVGKEAWMTTMLGLGAYGLARLLTGSRLAYPLILAAVAGMTVVRPHVSAIYLVGLGAAFVLRRSSGGAGGAGRKIVGLLVLSITAGLVLQQLQGFFGLEEGLDANAAFEKASSRSTQGGSQFEGAQPTSPAGIPWALVTVLFRPFPFEAGSFAALFTSLEGTILLIMFVWNLPRLFRLPVSVITRPYLGFVATYVLVFCFAFSAIGNFGILARQRTQLFPIAVATLCIPFESRLRTRYDLYRRQDDGSDAEDDAPDDARGEAAEGAGAAAGNGPAGRRPASPSGPRPRFVT